MRVVCIIPARGGSKGIPKKNIIPIAGKPLVSWSIESALNSKLVNETYVSSDDKEILYIAESLGAQPILRPQQISNDTASSESAIIHAVDEVQKKDSKPIDYIVFLQPTSPVRLPNDIDNAIKEIISSKADSLLSCRPLKDHFIWDKKDHSAFSLNFDYKNRKRRQEIETTWLENGSIYVFKPETLKKYNNRLGGKIAIYQMGPECSFQIDNHEDIQICEYFLNKLYNK